MGWRVFSPLRIAAPDLGNMDDIIAEFLTETNEGLLELDNALVQLERTPDDAELLAKIFRVFHTIKGSCGFLGLDRLGRISHRVEDALGLVRENRAAITPAFVTLLLSAVDRIRNVTTALAKTGQEPAGVDSDIIEALDKLQGAAVPAVPKRLEPLAAEVPPEPEKPSAAGDFSSAAERSETRSQPEAVIDTSHQTLRVSVDLLEEMMTVVSELVLTRNQLLQVARVSKDASFSPPLQRLNHVVTDIQEKVMKTRMQPIGNAWSVLPRIVRDVGAELGKKIELEMRGQDTELDRQVLEMIKDPLMHMVRNAADHGIESAEERVAAGKPDTGHIRLNAYHQGGHIIIEIADDGKGLSLQKIKGRALQTGLVTQDQLAKLSPQQVQQFIFRPGFSTSDGVTSVSGRGVGMDVVRTNIQRIGGTIEMTSVEGRGTTFLINIPLTLAIVSALIVEVSGSRFAFPQLAVSELVMVGGNGGARIEMVNDAAVLRLRDTLLPLVFLGDFMKVWDMGKPAHIDDGVHYVVVTKSHGVEFGLVVDLVLDMEEIVVKPVARNLKNVQIFSGNTILGDGSVIMIIDPSGLLQAANLREEAPQQVPEEKTLLTTSAQENLLLLFKAGDKTLKAAPLKKVSRLRKISTAEIELSNGRPVLQHLGMLMPVFNYDDAPTARDDAFLIVFEHEGQNAGLIADQVLDIARYQGSLAEYSNGKLLDTIILNQQSTDVVNLGWYMAEDRH